MEVKDLQFVEINGVVYINVTPHPINLIDGDEQVVLPSCGFVLNAQVAEEVVCERDGVVFVHTVFKGTEEGYAFLAECVKEFDREPIIIGSLIAAQAYPGQVVALVPAPGFERVPPGEKRMLLKKFTVF